MLAQLFSFMQENGQCWVCNFRRIKKKRERERSYPLQEIRKQNSHLLTGEAHIPFTNDATYKTHIP